MGRPRRVHCKLCERHIDDCGPLSSRGKCAECAVDQVYEAVDSMIGRRGPMFERYRERLVENARLTIERFGDG